MTIEKKSENGILTITPIGRVDSATSDGLSAFMEQYFTPDIQKIIFDFSGVDFISSKGLRIIVTVYKSLNGREMEIVNANASVKEIFRISGFSKFINVR